MAIKGEFKEIDSICVLDKLSYAGNLNNFNTHELSQFEFIEGDICDVELVNNLIPRFDAVINFAAESHVDRSILKPSDFFMTNTIGVQILLDSIRINPEIRFLQVSTDEVYGSISEGSWGEDSPLLPNSPYAASKASGEMVARSYCKTFGLDILISRCSNNYGPFHHPEKLIPLFITNLIEDMKIPIYGNGLNVRDWLHVDDHCRGLNLILQKGSSGQVYNIGGGRELSNLDISHQICNHFNKSEEEYFNFVPDRLGHDLRYSVNWAKIESELAYHPQVKFEEGLEATISWYLENEAWWKILKK